MEQESVEGPKLKIFFVTSPFELGQSGDSDYVAAISSLFGSNGVYLHTPREALDNPVYREELKPYLKENGKGGVRSMMFPSKTIEPSEEDKEIEGIRRNVVKNFISKIKSLTPKGTMPILNLQIRPPDTGMMIWPEDIVQFRAEGIRVVITCHEYRLNGIRGNTANKVSQLYFDQADHIIFFNEQDRLTAIKDFEQRHEGGFFPLDLLSKKSSLSQVGVPLSLGLCGGGSLDSGASASLEHSIPLLTEDLQGLAKREPNIIFFGSIREGKGFEAAVSLARCFMERRNVPGFEDARIIIAGEPSEYRLVTRLLVDSFGLDRIKDQCGNLEVFFDGAEREVMDRDKQKKLTLVLFELSKKIQELISTGKKGVFIAWANKLQEDFPIGSSQRLPIEFHFSVPPEHMPRIFSRCKYAFACDTPKGFALNASAMITMLAQACVLFSRAGCCTPGVSISESGEPVRLGAKYKDRIAGLAKAVVEELVKREEDMSLNLQQLDIQQRYFREYFTRDAILHGVIREADRIGLEEVFSRLTDFTLAKREQGETYPRTPSPFLSIVDFLRESCTSSASAPTPRSSTPRLQEEVRALIAKMDEKIKKLETELKKENISSKERGRLEARLGHAKSNKKHLESISQKSPVSEAESKVEKEEEKEANFIGEKM